jgi:hypothetical protein
MAREAAEGKVRELFIEELVEVRGGSDDPLAKVRQFIKDNFQTTYACCEEGPTSCC